MHRGDDAMRCRPSDRESVLAWMRLNSEPPELNFLPGALVDVSMAR